MKFILLHINSQFGYHLLNPNIYFHEVNVPNYPLFHYQPYGISFIK